MANENIQVIDKKNKNITSLIEKLGKIFPKQAVFMEGLLVEKELIELEKIGLIEKISNDVVTAKDYKKIGDIHSFKLTQLGLRYLNEITLRKINNRILILTIFLVVIGIIQIFLLIKGV